jgi:hypothetical protein
MIWGLVAVRGSFWSASTEARDTAWFLAQGFRFCQPALFDFTWLKDSLVQNEWTSTQFFLTRCDCKSPLPMSNVQLWNESLQVTC